MGEGVGEVLKGFAEAQIDFVRWCESKARDFGYRQKKLRNTNYLGSFPKV